MVNAISPQEAMLVSQELNEAQWDALITSVNKHLTRAWTITEARYGLFLWVLVPPTQLDRLIDLYQGTGWEVLISDPAKTSDDPTGLIFSPPENLMVRCV